jgi:hypothetical protein
MPEFTPKEKIYIKRYVVLDLEDRIGLPINDPGEDEVLQGIVAKLKEMCDA